jgi:hypothetical protein
MAPPTGPRRGGSAQKTALRPTRGGGISKHRPAPKTDIDGDIAMGGPPADTSKRGSGSSGRGARAGRGGRATSRMAQNIRNYATELAVGSNGAKTQPNKTVIKILGLKNSKAASNPDGGLRSLLDFLERKSKEKITLGRVQWYVRKYVLSISILTFRRASSTATMSGWKSTKTTRSIS